jgi:Fe-S-cluster containining protein
MAQRAARDAAGRVHLPLVLGAPLFEEPWQDEVVASTANTAVGVLGRTPTLEGVHELIRRVMGATSRLVDGLLAQAPEGAVACKAGCGHCCHVAVSVTAPEALTIVEHLKRPGSAAELQQLAGRVAAARERTGRLSSSERFSPDNPCVFLDDGRCRIYEVRPLACRGMNSLDATECETRLRDPESRAEFAEHGGGHLFVEPIRAFRAVSAGLQIGLSELYHLDMTPLDLTAAMDVLLHEDGASLAASWLAGGSLVQVY